ncbi:MAG: glycosyltransferase family 4 protein [Planctomycetes bacterium]|nr:glycosyltransferase family 4 protein [Planctomycetota bacterium]
MADPVARKIVLIEGSPTTAGEAEATLEFALRLQAIGREAVLLCDHPSSVAGDPRRPVTVLGYPTDLLGRIFWWRWPGLERLASFNPDLLHARGHLQARLAQILASRLQRPYILSVQSSVQSPKHLPVDRKWLRLILASSDSLREELVNDAKIPRDLVRLIPGGVDVAAFRGCRPPLRGQTAALAGRPRDPQAGEIPVVASVAPLVRGSGHDVFLRACREVLNHRPEIQFLIAGRGPESGSLRRLAHHLGLAASTTFVDYVEESRAILNAIDVFVLAAVEEGYGRIVLEAMACGRPVIVSGVGSFYSLVRDRESGLIVPQHDVPALARAILELLQNPGFAQDLAQQAHERARDEFSQDAFLRRILEVYDEAVSAGTNGRTGQP